MMVIEPIFGGPPEGAVGCAVGCAVAVGWAVAGGGAIGVGRVGVSAVATAVGAVCVAVAVAVAVAVGRALALAVALAVAVSATAAVVAAVAVVVAAGSTAAAVAVPGGAVVAPRGPAIWRNAARDAPNALDPAGAGVAMAAADADTLGEAEAISGVPDGVVFFETGRGCCGVEEITTAITPATRSAMEHEIAATTHMGGRRDVPAPPDVCIWPVPM
jgi:hypothetical protein